ARLESRRVRVRDVRGEHLLALGPQGQRLGVELDRRGERVRHVDPLKLCGYGPIMWMGPNPEGRVRRRFAAVFRPSARGPAPTVATCTHTDRTPSSALRTDR